jgi:ABC-type nickel/cobalt efflux system permease component RcnA
MGFWLLLRRMAGGPDHVHIGGGHHHHHHGPADHFHDHAGHAHPLPAASQQPGIWGLIVLGISGGIVPCWDAIAMFGFAVSAQRVWLALPLLLAFSAGLAGVLIAIGILVVQVKGFAGSRWGDSRLFRALPLLSAVVVTALGLWLCYDSVHAGGEW